MSHVSEKEYLESYRQRYLNRNRVGRSAMIDEIMDAWIQPGSAMDRKRVDQDLKNDFDSLRQNRIQAQMFYKHLTYEERFTIEPLNCKKYPYGSRRVFKTRFFAGAKLDRFIR